jgi:predicted RNA binding protein YcfA (HicA-like mRNA interferase family)
MMGKEVLARKFIPRTWHEIDNDTILLEDRRIMRDWTWIEVCWTLIRDGEKQQYPFTHRIYGASDLKRLLVETGFELIRIYGSLAANSPYDHAAERLVVVAQKPVA